ncbi:MAG: mandelate racemase/muconate lactonizing enzyme family protein [Pikeienuella sp.]
MRVSEVHIYQHDLPVKDGPYTMSSGALWAMDTTIVKLVADNGLIGWGEVCPVGPVYQPHHAGGARAALITAGSALIGVEVAPLILRRAMDGALNGHLYAKSAVDVAAHDLLGKQYGVPVHALLGGAAAMRLPSYYATGIGEPDEIARRARDKVDQGYPRIQIKAGGRDVAIDIETIRKVWEAVGHDAKLAVDANRGLTTRDALRLSRECVDIPIILEQPCNTIEEVAAIRHQISHAIYLDESTLDLNTVLRVVGDGLCDGFGMKVSRLGGLQPMTTLRDICAVRSMPHTCDDSWGGDIVTAACAHIGATVEPRLLEAVWLPDIYIDGHYDEANGQRVIGGHINVSNRPGLGVDPDEALFGAPIASFGG